MPTRSPTAARSRLGTTTFTDPQRDPGWAHTTVPAASPRALPSARRAGPDLEDLEVVGAGATRGLREWLGETSSTSLLVLEDGAVTHEWYAEGSGPETLFLGASMTKSALAHLVGRAVRDRALAVTDPVAQHVPELAGSGYDHATVLDLLTMTTGADWVEDHRDPDSRASRLLACFPGGDSRALLREVGAGVAAGTRWSYSTADSQVLDWVRERATGLTFGHDLARLWAALGCARDAAVAVDRFGVALAGGGLAATARDWARVALLAVDGTTDRGEQLLDPDWASAAARPAYPFTGVGRLPSSITSFAGFGYHWWPMDATGRRLTADGSRGQLACADRSTGAVVVKTSLWPYDDALADRQARDLSYLGLHALLDACTTPTPVTKESST